MCDLGITQITEYWKLIKSKDCNKLKSVHISLQRKWTENKFMLSFTFVNRVIIQVAIICIHTYYLTYYKWFWKVTFYKYIFLPKVGGFHRARRLPQSIKTGRQEKNTKAVLKIGVKDTNIKIYYHFPLHLQDMFIRAYAYYVFHIHLHSSIWF